MSAADVNLQAQVESVLGALLKAATVELTKLFESRYRASAAAVAATEVGEKNGQRSETVEPLDSVSSADGTQRLRSVGVQVDEDINTQLSVDLKGCREEEEEVEGDPTQTDILLAESNDYVHPEQSPLKEEEVEVVNRSALETISPTATDPKTKVVLQVSADRRPGSSQSTPSKQKPLLVQPEHRSDLNAVKFVCPLILKVDVPASEPECLVEPVQAEPQQTNVSTAKGTAYSPSPSDGAVAPPQVRVWERIPAVPEAENRLQLKLKVTSPDQKLMRPCAVQLVNMLTVPESGVKHTVNVANSHGADPKTGLPLPKDLRRHQGLHTGHRLCCFTQCGNGIWRLERVVAHSRAGYACSICDKKFKRRKILRRHERFHTGERPYSCSHCSKGFALRKSLRRHERFHTGERPHSCTQCGKSFRLRDNLKAHLRFHTGEKPFICNVCGKNFRIFRNLEKHKLSPCGMLVPSFRKIAGL